jgi:hypothetical protein
MRRSALALLGAAALSATGGCNDNDACKGLKETCLSITLVGAEGVSEADQVQVLVARKPAMTMQSMALGSPQPLPFKLAVLWPDGPATLSVRTLLDGKVNGVTSELVVDLRNGQHGLKKLTAFPALEGPGLPDLAVVRDLARPDMAKPPADMSMPDDLAMPEDLAMPPDLLMPPDLTMGGGNDM